MVLAAATAHTAVLATVLLATVLATARLVYATATTARSPSSWRNMDCSGLAGFIGGLIGSGIVIGGLLLIL
jgi:phosphoglycerate dehydrogenase-like enzyme